MLNKKDKNLVSAVLMHGNRLARKSEIKPRHTVVAGVQSKSGNLYFGVNCDGIHGSCAEIVAYANAVIYEDGNVDTIVSASIDAKGKSRILMPCGNCRQIFFEISKNISFIIEENGKLKKKSITKMLPFPYVHNQPVNKKK